MTIHNGTPVAPPAPLSADTALLPRPIRSHRTSRLTFAAVVDDLLLNDNVRGSETKAVARCRRAVQAAANSFAEWNDAGFKCYHTVKRLQAGGAVSLPSIVVDANKLVTVTGATLPTWLQFAHLKIDREWYPVTNDPGTGTTFTVDAPDLAAATYTNSTLEQIVLPLPQDFRKRGEVTEGRNRYPITDSGASTLQGWRDFYSWARNSASARVFGTITTDSRFQGGYMLGLWPAFGVDTVISLFYEREPAPLVNHRVYSGTITATGTTVTCDSSFFDATHIGSVVTAAADDNAAIRTAGASQDLAVGSRIITAIQSPTAVTVDSAWELAGDRAFYVSDIVDVLSGAMTEAFLAYCEYELAKGMNSKRTPQQRQQFMELMQLAMTADNRSNGPATGAHQEAYGSAIGEVDARPS